jgi:hypothetical protein
MMMANIDPEGIAADGKGNLYIASEGRGNHGDGGRPRMNMSMLSSRFIVMISFTKSSLCLKI